MLQRRWIFLFILVCALMELLLPMMFYRNPIDLFPLDDDWDQEPVTRSRATLVNPNSKQLHPEAQVRSPKISGLDDYPEEIDFVSLLQAKRGIEYPPIDLPMEQQSGGDDHEAMQDLDITLWTTQSSWNLKYGIIVTRYGVDSLHERLVSVRFRVCRDYKTLKGKFLAAVSNTTNSPSPPPCPRPPASKYKTTLSETFMEDPELMVYVWENVTAVSDGRYRVSKLLDHVSFWNARRKRHDKLNLVSKVKVKSCKGTTCPQLCSHSVTATTNATNGKEEIRHAPIKWDESDLLCKETHEGTKPPIREYGGYCRCESTCYTPAATQLNSTWPWRSQLEREQFYPNNEPAKFFMDRECVLKRNRQRTQARYTCDTVSTASANSDAIVRKESTNFSLSCHTHVAASHHVFFIPAAKLIFCGIPKVGITEWIKFFRFMLGAGDYLSLPHFKKDREEFFVRSLPIEVAQDLWNDPTWTRAVFLRDPAERLLSAYLDKIVGNSFTQRVFKIGSLTDKPKKVLSFEEFVEKISMNNTRCANPEGLHTCTDPHWKPQMLTCGLDYVLPLVDFVGNFNHISEHTKLLLKRVGLWDTYGRSFDDGSYDKKRGGLLGHICYMQPPALTPNSTQHHFGFNQRGSSRDSYKHSTGSQERLNEYYTPKLLAKVRQAYALDYAIWDDISSRPVEDVPRGRDLKHVKSFCRRQGSNYPVAKEQPA